MSEHFLHEWFSKIENEKLPKVGKSYHHNTNEIVWSKLYDIGNINNKMLDTAVKY